MRKITGTALLLVIALSLAACAENASVQEKEVSTEILKEAASQETTAVSASVKEPDAEPAPDTKESAEQPSASEEKETAGNAAEEQPKEYSNKEKEWRNYQLVNSESSIAGYLNLEIDYSIGKVQIQHQYYNENTYSLESWPLSDGLINVTEYDPMGGPPEVWQEYIEYSTDVIKLHYLDNEGVVDMENYQEFKLVH